MQGEIKFIKTEKGWRAEDVTMKESPESKELRKAEQENKDALIRKAKEAVPEILSWLNAALKEGLGAELRETDSNGNGEIDEKDAQNKTLRQSLKTANSLCDIFVAARQKLKGEKSPWETTKGLLWISGTPQPGKISCSHANNAESINITAKDAGGQELYSITITP